MSFIFERWKQYFMSERNEIKLQKNVLIFFWKFHQIVVWNLYENPSIHHVSVETSDKKLPRAYIQDIMYITFSIGKYDCFSLQ